MTWRSGGLIIPHPLDATEYADHAQNIARAQHPAGRLSAVPEKLLDGQGKQKLLRA